MSNTKLYYMSSSSEAWPYVCIERGDLYKTDPVTGEMTPRYYKKDAQGEFILDENGNKIPDTARDYGSADVPHGRQSVLFMSAKACLADPCTPQFELPDWTAQEKATIKSDCRTETIHDNPKREITDDEVLDRYYKHDPETGERTSEPTGEFESIEACRAYLEAQRDEEWEKMIEEYTEDYYKAKIDNCIIAPASMASFEQSHPFMDLIRDEKVFLLNLEYLSRWPLTLKEIRRLKEISDANEQAEGNSEGNLIAGID